jgi:uncharacterized protein YutE (UPF0331/DUF86 family)
MSQVNREAILSKLSRMVDRLDNLKRFETISLAAYLEDSDRQLIVERQLELLIQSALDINKAFLKRVVSPPASATISNYESFVLMGAQGCISSDLAQVIAPSGSFRNVLAHDYDDIDPNQVHAALQKALVQYPQYVRAIQIYLDTLED